MAPAIPGVEREDAPPAMPEALPPSAVGNHPPFEPLQGSVRMASRTGLIYTVTTEKEKVFLERNGWRELP